jgi:hypothetical protein
MVAMARMSAHGTGILPLDSQVGSRLKTIFDETSGMAPRRLQRISSVEAPPGKSSFWTSIGEAGLRHGGR